MDFKKWNQQAQEADTFLDTLGKTLWKRKWLLLFLLFCYLMYWGWTNSDPSTQIPVATEEQYNDYVNDYDSTYIDSL